MRGNVDWLYCSAKKTSAKYRLFCVPYAGGGDNIFQSWSAAAPRDLEVIGIRLPAHGGRITEAPISSINALVNKLAETLSVYGDKPFALFGHSVGALFAFLTCRRLFKNLYAGRESTPNAVPLALFSAAREAPSVKSALTPLHKLPTEHLVTELGKRYDGIPKDIMEDKNLLERFIPALQVDLEMNENYQHQHENPIPCSICVFGGRSDLTVGREDLHRWKEETSGNFAVQWFKGGHFFLNESRDEILQTIAVWMEHESTLKLTRPF